MAVSGTAASGSDYTTTPGSVATLAFTPGQNTRTIVVNPVNDTATEGDEAVLVQIANGPYDIGGAGYASVIIQDNDIPPTVFIRSPAAQGVVVAPSNGVEFAVETSDDGSPQALTYQWSQLYGPGTVSFGQTNAATTPAIFSAAGTYLVRVTASDGQFSSSDQITVNIGGTSTLQAADWLSSDIGPATLRGFSGPTGSAWFVSAAGTGYATDSDRAHAVTRQVTGDGVSKPD